MRSKLFCAGILLLFLPILATSASAQARYAAFEDHPRYAVGLGASGYDVDWGHGIMYGPTLWADWNPQFFPGFLSGVGIEMTARDISWHRGDSHPTNFRTDTLSGGLIYHAPKRAQFFHLRPYVKGSGGFGSIDFHAGIPNYNHDTRTVWSFGGGVDYALTHHFALRGDYEYQLWPDFFHHHSLTPNGVTVGAMYSFGGGRH
jgi:opacity protein-like surface antigen